MFESIFGKLCYVKKQNNLFDLNLKILTYFAKKWSLNFVKKREKIALNDL